MDYSSKDCAKIIASKPTTGEYHGCPFKYYGDPELAKFLKSKYPNVDQTALNEIMEKKSKNEFEVRNKLFRLLAELCLRRRILTLMENI